MRERWIVAAAFVTALGAATLGSPSAQQVAPGPSSIINNDENDAIMAAPPSPPAKPARAHASKKPPAFEHDPDLDAEDQLAPSQIAQPMPAAVAAPSRAAGSPRAAKARSPRVAAPQAVTCDGAFAKDSSHRKLALAFGSQNVAYTQVDADTSIKLASVLFPKDPKRRLEVWWSDPDGRSDTHLIVINGQSNWSAPGGLTLGLGLAQLEDLNGKPFKLIGFNKEKVAVATDWDGGKLAALPGGCKLGISLRADPTASPASVGALPADREYTSADSALRAVNPTVSEILVGY